MRTAVMAAAATAMRRWWMPTSTLTRKMPSCCESGPRASPGAPQPPVLPAAAGCQPIRSVLCFPPNKCGVERHCTQALPFHVVWAVLN
jgi:hypothetical protein